MSSNRDDAGRSLGPTSASAKIRKPPAVAAFGLEGERARQLRALGDALNDVIAGLKQHDLLAIGNARKLLVEWREIGEPLLWYPTELRSDGKLVIAAEAERATFILPGYQAGLRAVLLQPESSAHDVLLLCRQLLQLERGALSRQGFFNWLWRGNPRGLTTLLGHPLDAIPTTVLENEIAAKDIWAAHTAAAMDEWNSLAWNAAQTVDAQALEQRYRAPLNRLAQRIDKRDLALSSENVEALRKACDDEPRHTNAERQLVEQRPDLAAFLPPDASTFDSALDAGTDLAAVLSYLDQGTDHDGRGADPEPSEQTESATCIDVIEKLCASMRAVGAHGPEHPEAARSLESCRKAIARAKPPFALRFLSDGVLRGRTPLVLSLSGFRRAQIIARVLYPLGTPQLLFDEVPSREILYKLVQVFVDATQGTHRSFAPKLKGIRLLALNQVDPTSNDHDEAEVDRVLRAELYAASTQIEQLQARMSSPEAKAKGTAWSWSRGQAVIATLERCLALGVTATGRALEVAPPEWTSARRACAATAQTLIALTRLRTSDLTRRAAGHAMLAIVCAGLPGQDYESAARAARDVLCAQPTRKPTSPSPHRLRTIALSAAAASSQDRGLAATRLLRTVYTLERMRIDDRGQRLSRVDLQAWLASALGRDVDEAFGRLILTALGVLPPGTHVLCEGRLGVVMGPGKTSLTPLVLVGGELSTPEQSVTLSSPLGMSPWSR